MRTSSWVCSVLPPDQTTVAWEPCTSVARNKALNRTHHQWSERAGWRIPAVKRPLHLRLGKASSTAASQSGQTSTCGGTPTWQRLRFTDENVTTTLPCNIVSLRDAATTLDLWLCHSSMVVDTVGTSRRTATETARGTFVTLVAPS